MNPVMQTTTPQAETSGRRKPLGWRDKATVAHTVLRVTGQQTPVLDVAAFQSFAD